MTKPRVLFLDDDVNLLAGLRRRIRPLRHAVWDLSFLENPREAVGMHLKQPFDVVVTDYAMPILDGIGVAAAMVTAQPRTKLIMLTGAADLDTAMQLINESIVEKFYTKPCEADVLIEAVERCLRAQGEQETQASGPLENASLAVLDRLSVGVIVCDPDAKVMQINQAAATICTAKDGVSVDRSGFLRATNANRNQDLIAAFAKEDAQSGLTLDRRDEVTGLAVIVSPMSDGGRLVLISDPLTHTPPSVGVLQTLYDMPPSEARLLHGLVRGFSLKEAAQEMNITESSARTYLKRIFSRTATNSQPDLVRTVLLTAVPREEV